MKSLLITSLIGATALTGWAQGTAPASTAVGLPVDMVITAEPLRGAQPPALSAADVSVLQDSRRLPVIELLPLQGDNAGLQLYILIDERVDPSQPALFGQLRGFISTQAPATAVGVAYMFNGDARVAQAPTTDHARASEALRATTGNDSAEANPFTALSMLIGRWPGGALRREVLMVTDGMDRFNDTGDYNMYVDDAIADAQRAGVIVYSLYAPAIGHASHSPSLVRWGQNYLGDIAEATGGEACLPVSGSPAPYDRYFSDLDRHFANQYRITFLATPETAEFQRVTIEAPGKDVDLVYAHKFYLIEPKPRS